MARPSGLSTPTIMARGAKIGIYGEPGTGKTELVMSVTQSKHLLLHDTEGRSQYYDPSAGHGFEVVYSKDVNDSLDLLAYAEELHAKGERVAFAIDSFSSLWIEQQEVAERAGATRGGQAKFSSWGVAKKPLKRFYAQLFTTAVDVLITMRAKPRYEQNAKKEVVDYGYNVADTERGLGYAVDLIVELRKEDLPPGQVLKPDNYWAVVTKASGPKNDNPLPIGTRITDPSFDKLVALRISGNGGGQLHLDSNVGLQVARATITTSKNFWPWAQELLDTTEEEVRAFLTKKHGDPLDGKQLPLYIEDVWELAQTELTTPELAPAG